MSEQTETLADALPKEMAELSWPQRPGRTVMEATELERPLGLSLSEGLGPLALKPCAHCGHTRAPKMTSAAELNCDDGDDFSAWPHSDSFAVICDAARPGGAGGCGAMGGFMPTEREAAQRWNTRAGDDDEPAYTAQQVADACMAAEIPDSKCESLLLALLRD